MQFLTGAYSAKGDAAGNEVTVSGGTVHKNILGGDSGSGESRGNTVRVTGGTIGTQEQSGSVYGGYSTSGSAGNNTVSITGGTLRGSVMGGCVENGTGAAIGNTVLFSGGSIGAGEGLYGGYTDGQARAMPPETPSSSKGLPIWAAPRCTAAARQAAAGTCAPAIRWKSAPRA